MSHPSRTRTRALFRDTTTHGPVEIPNGLLDARMMRLGQSTTRAEADRKWSLGSAVEATWLSSRCLERLCLQSPDQVRQPILLRQDCVEPG